ncbi:hypothetical protein HD842_004278 [Massilia aurea]|jgi:hypothetical protein|uniref:Uncharacterized protein n=1 Tax=Massilia aurea TaxID=373040 RepID=A0A7W9X448_9BURK|nr:hypothetical protein [Massilia aurea]
MTNNRHLTIWRGLLSKLADKTDKQAMLLLLEDNYFARY